MQRVTFTAEKGNTGNDAIGKMKIEMNGMDVNNAATVMDHNFDGKTRMGSSAVYANVPLYSENKELIVDAFVSDAGLDMYPAVGITVLEKTEIDGIIVVTKCKLNHVSLCSNPNADPTIKTIRQQIANKK